MTTLYDAIAPVHNHRDERARQVRRARRAGFCTGCASVILLMSALMLHACKGKGAEWTVKTDPSKDITHASDAVKDIIPRTGAIDQHVEKVERDLPSKTMVKVGPALGGVRTESAIIRRNAETAVTGLKNAGTDAVQLKNDYGELQVELRKEKERNKSSLRKAAGFGIPLGIIGLALSAGAFAGSYTKIGRMGAAGAGVLLMTCIIVGWYHWWIGIVVGGTLAVGFSIYIARKLYLEKWASKRAVAVGEGLKQRLGQENPQARLAFFGEGARAGEVDGIDYKLGVPAGAKHIVDVARSTLPIKATPLPVALPVAHSSETALSHDTAAVTTVAPGQSATVTVLPRKAKTRTAKRRAKSKKRVR